MSSAQSGRGNPWPWGIPQYAMTSRALNTINMALEEKKACLWHAFNTLDDQRKGTGLKGQLKVSGRILVEISDQVLRKIIIVE